MANQLSPPFGTPIIAPHYCDPGPHPVHLIITRERSIGENFTVTNSNGNIVFSVKSNIVSIVTPRRHMYLFDAYGNPIVHLQGSVKATWFGSSWDVYIGDSNILVAQINKKLGTIFSREKYMVTVSPNIDHAFIVALIVTLES
ncbi:protein LURP-one-related 1-like [Phaseolus vulgaris]|uniref:protein LURP-one-related 1-like n=1 Tax=Phaseolus vulgaris TaxID=3885 RepID=UPI0035CA0FC8